MKAVLCPICNGSGEVDDSTIDGPEVTTIHMKLCHGCGGKGWVEVGEDSPLPFYWQPGPIGDQSRCPACGCDRNSPALTGCPLGSHYGSYCDVHI